MVHKSMCRLGEPHQRRNTVEAKIPAIAAVLAGKSQVVTRVAPGSPYLGFVRAPLGNGEGA